MDQFAYIIPTGQEPPLVSSTDRMRVRIEINNYVFETEGPFEDVIKEQEHFILRLLEKKSSTNEEKNISKKNNATDIGIIIKKTCKETEIIKSKKDVKAKIIPLMYLAEKCGETKPMSVADIKELVRLVWLHTRENSEICP